MRWLVFTNLYVACCGAALTAATYTLLGLPPRFDAVAGLVFCCTLVIYNLDRLTERQPGDSEHERWVEAHRKPLWALTWCGFFAGVTFATQLSAAALWSLLPAGLIACGYSLPILYWGGRWRGLKALPGAKLLLIALVWTYATAGLPMLEAMVPLSPDSTAVLVTRLLFIAAVALPFDVPDMQRDRQAGIHTIPTLLGVGATRSIAIMLTLAAMLLSLINLWPAAFGVLLSLGCTLRLVHALKPDRGVVYFMVLLDGMLLVQAGALWIIAGPG